MTEKSVQNTSVQNTVLHTKHRVSGFGKGRSEGEKIDFFFH